MNLTKVGKSFTLQCLVTALQSPHQPYAQRAHKFLCAHKSFRPANLTAASINPNVLSLRLTCVMPICIECRYPVPQLYHTSASAKAGGSTGSGGGTGHGSSGTAPPPNASAANGHTTGAPASLDSHSSQRRQSQRPDNSQRRSAHTRQPSRAKGGGESARRTLAGADVRLTQCPRCKRFADKYVEHDFVVLFIDLVLVKPQVGAHRVH